MATGECMIEDHAYTFDSTGGYMYSGIHRNGFDDELLTKAFELCCKSEADGLHMTDLINQERLSYGIAPVEYNRNLAVLATYRCLHMEKNNYYSHYFTSSTSPQFALDYDAYRLSLNGGENLSRSSYTDIMELSLVSVNAKSMSSFRNSSSHHNNIINSRWTSVGIGYCMDPDSNNLTIVQLYK